jgi:hypothetical protein
MKNLLKNKLLSIKVSVVLLLVFLTTITCSKTDESPKIIQEEINSSVVYDDTLMDPGPDPEFVSVENRINVENLSARVIGVNTINTWERYMYIDKTDTIYNSISASRRLSGYLKKYGFKGVYLYSTSAIVSSTSNYSNFSRFVKTLSDSGIVYRGVASGSATTFKSGGGISNYNNSQSDATKKINRANLELEWWNNVTTWDNWNSINQQISLATITDNDFYEGWYKNMGSTIDTVAARDQVRFSDRVLLHCYQNGIPTYSYANAQSTGATGGRLDIIAKGARQVGRKIDLYIIISSENTAWGASNTFTGPALANAYLSGQANPYLFIENQAYNNIFNNMTTFQKQWINLKGFVWFTKRYCYKAVPPR